MRRDDTNPKPKPKNADREPPKEPPGLACPSCGCRYLPVIRTVKRGDYILRVRECGNGLCARRCNTREKIG